MKRKLFLIGGSLLILLFIVWLGFSLIGGLYFSSKSEIAGESRGVFSPMSLSPSMSLKEGFSSTTPAPALDGVQLTQKKIIKNGFLTLVVGRTEEAVSAITKIVEGKSGFIASLSVNDGGDKGKQASMTARVPFNQFSGAFEEIKVLAEVVEAESINGQDVTEQFIDLEAHLKNLRATETQFLEVLKTAKTVEDILKVQDRLSQVRGQIESLEGQLKYLTNQTDLATITVSLSEEPTISLSLRDFRPLTVIKTSLQALLQGLVVVFNVLVRFIIVLLPIIVIAGVFIGFALWILWKAIKALKQRFFS